MQEKKIELNFISAHFSELDTQEQELINNAKSVFQTAYAPYSGFIVGASILLENGEIIRGLDVLAYSYDLVGLGWVYYPLKIKLLSPLLRLVYRYWAKYRLQITGRSDIEKLCTSQCEQ